MANEKHSSFWDYLTDDNGWWPYTIRIILFPLMVLAVWAGERDILTTGIFIFICLGIWYYNYKHESK